MIRQYVIVSFTSRKLFGRSVIVVFLGSVLASALSAAPDRHAISSICESAALVAARESGVPLDVLRAISLTETGRKWAGELAPWPWTVNMEGAGKWFDTRAEARAYVDRHFERGARSFDVGCFQINYRWHGNAFSSIEEMFEPTANARYAAKFLSELYEEFGNWSKAAGAFHSRTPKYARKYTARFDRIRQELDDWSPVPIANATPMQEPQIATLVARVNRFPLLQAGAPGSIASLVPLRQGGTTFIDFSRPRAQVALR